MPKIASDPGIGEKIMPTNGLMIGAMASLIAWSTDFSASWASVDTGAVSNTSEAGIVLIRLAPRISERAAERAGG